MSNTQVEKKFKAALDAQGIEVAMSSLAWLASPKQYKKILQSIDLGDAQARMTPYLTRTQEDVQGDTPEINSWRIPKTAIQYARFARVSKELGADKAVSE